MWKQLKIPLILLSFTLIAGTLGFLMLEDNISSLLDSFFFTLVTVTTVGYGDVTPHTLSGKILGIIVIIMGVGSALATIQAVFGGTVRKRIREELKLPEDNVNKQDHFIICGYGKVGRAIAEQLLSQNEAFVVIENENSRVREMVGSDIAVVEGDARDESTLEKAGIRKAKCLLTTLDDAQNVFVALTAKQLNPQINIIAKIETIANRPKFEKAGIDQSIACHSAGAKMMINSATVEEENE